MVSSETSEMLHPHNNAVNESMNITFLIARILNLRQILIYFIDYTIVKERNQALCTLKPHTQGFPLVKTISKTKNTTQNGWCLVRVMGLEPIRLSTHAPQTCLSAYSSTLAFAVSSDCFNIIADNLPLVNPFFKKISKKFLLRIFRLFATFLSQSCKEVRQKPCTFLLHDTAVNLRTIVVGEVKHALH